NSFDILGGRAEAYTALSQFQNAIDDYAAAIGEIANQIESEPDLAVRETMSARAMNYFEKSGAVRITLGDMAGARVDLEAANTLATAMNDYDSATRLRQLIAELPE
ncbi:MAG: hypothetical protein LBR41_00960, partial [Rickettsiales bacterium]|nr:hypothetical protein [Rickettsiales bacterium]